MSKALKLGLTLLSVCALAALPWQGAQADENDVPTLTMQTVLEQIHVDAGAVTSLKATCPSGTHLTGGGYAVGSQSSEVYVLQNLENQNGWRVDVINRGNGGTWLYVKAVCMNLVIPAS